MSGGFVFYGSERAPFTRWFFPLGFSIIAVLFVWREGWTWFTVFSVVFAIVTWASSIHWWQRANRKG